MNLIHEVAMVFSFRHFLLAIFMLSPLSLQAQNPISKTLSQSMIRLDARVDNKTNFAALYRQTVVLDKLPSVSKLHLFAYTRYELYINGQYILRGPSRFENASPEFDTIDVTRYLKIGRNVIAIRVRNDLPSGRVMKHDHGVAFLLDFGNTFSPITSDMDCQAIKDDSILPAKADWGSIHDVIDARKIPGDWMMPDFDDSKWPAAVKVDTSDSKVWPLITPRRIPQLRETELQVAMPNLPVDLATGQEFVAKLPRISQVYSLLDFAADDGSQIDVTFGMPDGSHYSINHYTARAGNQTYMTGDTFGADRIIIKIITGRISLKKVRAVEMLYPFTRLGSFETNDASLNKLWEICVRSLELMSEDSYVDCADRERVEWMDDQPPAYALNRLTQSGPSDSGKPVYGDGRLMRQLLRRTALTQQPDGRVKAHTCSDRWDIHAIMEDRACDWVEGALTYYNATADKSLLDDIWPNIVKQMDWFLKQRTSRGLVVCREWIVWGNPMGYQVCEGTGMNAFVYRALRDAATIGRIVGDQSNAQRLDKAADELYKAINTHLYDEKSHAFYSGLFADGHKPATSHFVPRFLLQVDSNGLAEPCFDANLFALDRGIVPPDRLADVQKYVFDNMNQVNAVMAGYFLLNQLYSTNTTEHDRSALKFIREKWKACIESDWGTSFEGFSATEHSRCHIYGMVPGIFLSQYVLGVKYDGLVTGNKILINPRLGDLTSASGTVVTELGLVNVAYKVESQELSFDISLPEGATGELQLPASSTSKLIIDGKEITAKLSGNTMIFPIDSGHLSGKLKPW